ncbi:hypothetical protein ACFE04_012723 [Oxalis oulophora]
MGDDDDDEMRSSSSSYRVLLISAGASHSVALLCIYKALELRDGGPDYLGKGVLKAEHNVNLIIAPTLIGKHIANLAGNKNLVLTVPAFNVINGGSHARNKLAMLEFMILPVGASSFKESMKMDVEVYHHLKEETKAVAQLQNHRLANLLGCCSEGNSALLLYGLHQQVLSC